MCGLSTLLPPLCQCTVVRASMDEVINFLKVDVHRSNQVLVGKASNASSCTMLANTHTQHMYAQHIHAHTCLFAQCDVTACPAWWPLGPLPPPLPHPAVHAGRPDHAWPSEQHRPTYCRCVCVFVFVREHMKKRQCASNHTCRCVQLCAQTVSPSCQATSSV